MFLICFNSFFCFMVTWLDSFELVYNTLDYGWWWRVLQKIINKKKRKLKKRKVLNNWIETCIQSSEASNVLPNSKYIYIKDKGFWAIFELSGSKKISHKKVLFWTSHHMRDYVNLSEIVFSTLNMKSPKLFEPD